MYYWSDHVCVTVPSRKSSHRKLLIIVHYYFVCLWFTGFVNINFHQLQIHVLRMIILYSPPPQKKAKKKICTPISYNRMILSNNTNAYISSLFYIIYFRFRFRSNAGNYEFFRFIVYYYYMLPLFELFEPYVQLLSKLPWTNEFRYEALKKKKEINKCAKKLAGFFLFIFYVKLTTRKNLTSCKTDVKVPGKFGYGQNK